jgi:PPK2 family polyphosphate:nucleotide phosphotransferase
MKHLSKELIVAPGSKTRLEKLDAGDTHGIKKEEALGQLDKNLERLAVLQYQLYAEAQRSLLVVLQGIDAGGKDGTILHVMSGLNPQGVSVTSFKAPEGAEKRHDYLWRVHQAVPERGKIGIFNRSHYEDVLIVRVHDLVPKSVWSKRYAQINDFERMLSDNGVRIIKFLLYISKDEQAKRFRDRLEDKSKNWKFSRDDLKEREYWDQYIEAYEEMLRKCSTGNSPWYVIPANRKWFRNLAVSQIVRETLEDMDLKYPMPTEDLSGITFE